MSAKVSTVSPTAVKIDAKLKMRLAKIAEIKQRTIHWLMKDAIERYVEQTEQEEKLRLETLERWQEAVQGKVVKNKDIMSWLDTWGTNKERDEP